MREEEYAKPTIFPWDIKVLDYFNKYCFKEIIHACLKFCILYMSSTLKGPNFKENGNFFMYESEERIKPPKIPSCYGSMEIPGVSY